MYASYNDSLTVRSDIVSLMFTDEYWNLLSGLSTKPSKLISKDMSN